VSFSQTLPGFPVSDQFQTKEAAEDSEDEEILQAVTWVHLHLQVNASLQSEKPQLQRARMAAVCITADWEAPAVYSQHGCCLHDGSLRSLSFLQPAWLLYA